MSFKDNYTARHNRVMDHIEDQLNAHLPESFVYKERIVTPNLITMDDEVTFPNLFQDLPHRKPDLVLVNHDTKSVFLVEISCPWDRFVDKCYDCKFDKYKPLSEIISLLDYDCKLVVLVIGSTGSVHYRFRTGLRMLGFSNRIATAITKTVLLV